MNVISVCSGAGGMDLGFERAGHRTVALCEALSWLRELLAKRFPGVPCHPDLTELDPATLPPADILIGGTPCQDLSVTGNRAGLEGSKSSLFFDFIRIRNATGVEWAVWENVEGALTSNEGMDFACVLGAFVGADVAVPADGWPGAGVVAGPWGGACWRVLDAQHFGVPQRRRRVFVVGRLGGPCPSEVLLEPASSSGHPAPGGEAREGDPAAFGLGVAGTLGTRTGGSRTTDLDGIGAYISAAVCAKWSKGTGGPAGDECQNLIATGAPDDPDRMRTPDGMAGRVDGAMSIAAALTAGGHGAGVNAPGRRKEDDVNLAIVTAGTGRGTPIVYASAAFHENDRKELRESDTAWNLTTGGGKPVQGYPAVRIGDDVIGTDRCSVDLRPDNRRYSACGNGVVAPVAEWIGRRLASIVSGELEGKS